MSKASDDWTKMKYGRAITEEELRKRTHPAWPYIHFNPGKPVEPAKVDELLRGVIDLHIHGAPLGGWLPGRPRMTDTCVEASDDTRPVSQRSGFPRVRSRSLAATWI